MPLTLSDYISALPRQPNNLAAGQLLGNALESVGKTFADLRREAEQKRQFEMSQQEIARRNTEIERAAKADERINESKRVDAQHAAQAGLIGKLAESAVRSPQEQAAAEAAVRAGGLDVRPVPLPPTLPSSLVPLPGPPPKTGNAIFRGDEMLGTVDFASQRQAQAQGVIDSINALAKSARPEDRDAARQVRAQVAELQKTGMAPADAYKAAYETYKETARLASSERNARAVGNRAEKTRDLGAERVDIARAKEAEKSMERLLAPAVVARDNLISVTAKLDAFNSDPSNPLKVAPLMGAMARTIGGEKGVLSDKDIMRSEGDAYRSLLGRIEAIATRAVAGGKDPNFVHDANAVVKDYQDMMQGTLLRYYDAGKRELGFYLPSTGQDELGGLDQHDLSAKWAARKLLTFSQGLWGGDAVKEITGMLKPVMRGSGARDSLGVAPLPKKPKFEGKSDDELIDALGD